MYSCAGRWPNVFVGQVGPMPGTTGREILINPKLAIARKPFCNLLGSFYQKYNFLTDEPIFRDNNRLYTSLKNDKNGTIVNKKYFFYRLKM